MTDYADLKSATTPEVMRAALAARADELLMAAHPHHPSAMADVREAEHRGHQIEVRTSYAITVDGRPFDIHIVVDNEGRVYYHGLPTRDFLSVIDLVKKAIDQFSDDFKQGDTDQSHPHEPGHMHTEATEGHGNSQREGN